MDPLLHTRDQGAVEKQWVEAGESVPKRPKTQPSSGKVMATVFWDVQGIIHIDYLERGKTITDQYYSESLDRWMLQSRLKDHIWHTKKSSHIKTMHRHTKELKQ